MPAIRARPDTFAAMGLQMTRFAPIFLKGRVRRGGNLSSRATHRWDIALKHYLRGLLR